MYYDRSYFEMTADEAAEECFLKEQAEKRFFDDLKSRNYSKECSDLIIKVKKQGFGFMSIIDFGYDFDILKEKVYEVKSNIKLLFEDRENVLDLSIYKNYDDYTSCQMEEIRMSLIEGIDASNYITPEDSPFKIREIIKSLKENSLDSI
ncbi:MAG: hypothetical protein R3Y64_11375 [Peptostreptococcaceae bacterium]